MISCRSPRAGYTVPDFAYSSRSLRVRAGTRHWKAHRRSGSTRSGGYLSSSVFKLDARALATRLFRAMAWCFSQL